MHNTIEAVRLRVVSGYVKCWDTPIPQGEYDGYINWEHPDDGNDPMRTSVQLMPENLPALVNKPCQVLQYLNSAEIEVVGPN